MKKTVTKGRDGTEITSYPWGASLIEAEEKPFQDEERPGATMRRFLHGKVEVVSWKHEGECGPLFYDGIPAFELCYAGEQTWHVGWVSRSEAKRLAEKFGARFEDA